MNLAAAESLERLFRQTERYQDLSLILQRKAEIVDEPADKKDALFQAAAIEEDVLELPRGGDRRLPEGPLHRRGRPPRARRAHQALSRAVPLGGPARGLLEEGRSRRRPRRKEAHLLPGRRGLRARARRRAQAIDTYTKMLELDPDDLQALSRLDVLYEQAQNWQELLGVLTRESEMCEDPNEAISFQYRIAELYEKRLDDVIRAIELYREILQRQVRSRADARRPRRAEERRQGSARRRRGPRAGLRSIERLAEADRVHEVQVRHATRPVHAGRSAPSHRRASTRTRSRTTRPRSTRTRARSRSTTATSRRSRTSSGSR